MRKVREHYSILKEVFIQKSADMDFPFMNREVASELLRDMHVIDQQTFHLTDSDRLFIAANVEVEDQRAPDNPANLLCRYEFIEFLVRVARTKYKEKGDSATVADAFQQLLDKHVIPYHAEVITQWQRFREDYLLSNIVDHLVHANKKSL